MMLAAMGLVKRPDLESLRWSSPGNYTFTKFQRDFRIMSGYTEAKVLVVGAAGGYAGDQISGDIRGYSAGPGGGGFSAVKTKLSSLPTNSPIVVGGQPTKPPSSSGRPANGGSGGGSSFHICSATGGYGAVSSDFQIYQPSLPGKGGVGKIRGVDIGTTEPVDDKPDVNGIYVTRAGPDGEIHEGSCGGRGGGGRYTFGIATPPSGPIGLGAKGGGSYQSNPSPYHTNLGRGGGGCTVIEFNGKNEHFGVGNTSNGAEGYFSQGYVAINFS